MNAVVFILYSIFLFGFASTAFPKEWRRFYLLFLIRTFLIAALFVLPDKLAEVEIFEVTTKGLSHNFLVYYMLSFPIVEVFGLSRSAMASVSHVGIFIISIYVVNKAGFQSRRNRQLAMITLTMFPDILYFSAFSLRDPLIAGLSMLLVFHTYQHIALHQQLSWKLIGIVTLMLYSLRPEVIIWLGAVMVFHSIVPRLSVRGTLLFTFIGVVALISAFDVIAPELLKFVNIVPSDWKFSGLDALRAVADMRFERQFSDADGSGSTSSILSRSTYYDTGNAQLIAIQSVSFIFLTTVGISSATLVAILTILVLLGMVLRKFIFSTLNKVQLYILLTGYMAYAMYSPLIVNGGNAFRMRLPLLAIMLLFIVLPKPRKDLVRSVG